MPLYRLVARYFEMNVRPIHPVSRRVHFSDQTHASLGKLLRPDHDDTSGRDAWGTVFRLRQLIVDGTNVNAFLSKNIRSATGWDGLLWHYGMHHFHLSSDVGVDGFVKRSDHLLFAILAPLDAYFVDVRPHPPKDGVEWVSQELLHIVHSNWPELIEANVLHGVCGTQLTDCEIHQLRRKNMNYAIEIDGKAIAPLGGGMAGDGSSVLCTNFASKLLRDLRHHEEVLNNDEIRETVARNLRAQGFWLRQALSTGICASIDLRHRREQATRQSGTCEKSYRECRSTDRVESSIDKRYAIALASTCNLTVLNCRFQRLCQVNQIHSEISINCRCCSTQFQWLSLMEKCRKQPIIS